MGHTKLNIIALHGFLGSPADWVPFREMITHPLALDREELPFREWALYFNQTKVPKVGKNLLIGYSLGARLAMHILLDNPSLWAGAIFISGHPGLKTKEEQQARLSSDRHWAQRFLTEPWDLLIQEWNRNPIFDNRPFAVDHLEQDFDRKTLANQLCHWSLGHQENLRPQLKKLNIPLLFMSGEKDSKFSAIAQECTFASIAIIPGVAHRIPWENPVLFQEQVELFAKRLVHAN
jgi:2-succinyl-6-hydroxy-2,4-cyclohexadiene-1-carboxylate synthase